MKLRVKRDLTAYVHDRRYREGQIVDVPEKMLKKATKESIEALEKELTKTHGAEEAKKHGLKPGQFVLPKWAELPSKPLAPEAKMPGVKSTSGDKPKEGEGLDAGDAAGDEGGDQNVL